MSEFDVLLISIDWEGPDRVRDIISSKKILEASAINGNHYDYDIVLYNKEDELYFQFAIKTKHTPFLKTKEGTLSQNNRLYKIHDDLWIFKGDWRTGQRGISYHHCPSTNTIGKIEIGISENLHQIQHYVTIDINSNIDDFDFDQLKNDFEGELWNLITSNKSNVSSDKIEIGYCDKIFRFAENQSIIEFIKAFDHIEKNPKLELTHTKEFRRIEKVVPIAETFYKLSTKGSSKFLPSKAVIENYDIYENRFVCFMLHSIHLIVSKNIKYTSFQTDRLRNEIEILSKKIEVLKDPDPKISIELVEQQISFQEQRVNGMINKWRTISNSLSQNIPGTYNQIRIRVKHSHHELENTFWCSTNTVSFCLFKFPNSVAQYISEDTDFHFEAIFNQIGLVKTKSGKTYPTYEMTSARKMANAELIFEQKVLNRQRSNKTILVKNNCSQFSIISASEKEKYNNERNNQIHTLSKKIEKINLQIKNIDEFNKEQSKLLPLLEQRLKSSFFRKIKWKNFQGFKPSMSFIQNISYRNALRYYKEILRSEGLDISIFDLYENVTSFGIREMPQVYELWCLVTIIKVLEESFRFVHVKQDLSTLLKKIDPKKQNISEHIKIDFNNSLAGRCVTLHYQKSIGGNKRPDFILEIISESCTINLVLDAKFKNYNYKQSIIYETVNLKNKYTGNRNYVFILHPCKDGSFENRSIKYTNLGGERIFYEEDEEQLTKFPFHEYGYIELKPNFTDTLKKLLAMSFEYLLEPSRNAKKDNNIDPRPENEMFCISCGKANITIKPFLRGGNRHYYNCSCNETDCGHKIYIDYCWKCKTKLFKHGSYWDYHLESTWSIFDIRCPHCGMTVADSS